MKISTRGRYALRFLIDLACHQSSGYVTLKDISKRQGISIKYLEQITAILTKNNCLKSVRGPQGGYMLSKKPEEYSIGELLRLTEGDIAPVACLAEEQNTCEKKDTCPTLGLWQGLEKVIYEYLDSKTLADLIK